MSLLKPSPLMLAALAAASLAGPLSVSAQTTVKASYHHMAFPDMRRETVDQRITHLHSALKITPNEEKDWDAVAQVMRWNAAAMDKMVADRTAIGSHAVSAVDDLKSYEKFNRAHLEGLKNLIASFETLYTEMPAGQKATADHVFEHFGRESRHVNG